MYLLCGYSFLSYTSFTINILPFALLFHDHYIYFVKYIVFVFVKWKNRKIQITCIQDTNVK